MHESRTNALFGESFRLSEGHIRLTAKDPGENADTDRQWKAVKCLNQRIRGQFDDGTSQRGCTLCENTASLPVCHRGCVAVRVDKIARRACLHAPMRRLRLREQADQVCLRKWLRGEDSRASQHTNRANVTHDAESNDDKKSAQQDIN